MAITRFVGPRNQMPVSVAAVGLALLFGACVLDEQGLDDELGSSESELTLRAGLYPQPVFTRYAPDRLAWDHNAATGSGQLWTLTDVGGRAADHAVSGSTGTQLIGAAGDRVLWHDPFAGTTELKTIDVATGAVTATHTIPHVTGYSAVSLTLASPVAWNCYERGAAQDYYVMWNSGGGTYAVQLVAGDGSVRRTTFSNKPLQHLNVQAIWFGYGADGYLWAMFRGNTTAYRYRAQWAQTHYTHNSLRISSLSGFVPVGMAPKPHPRLVWTAAFSGGTSWNDHILYAHPSNGQARLAAFNWHGQPITSTWTGTTANVVWSFANQGQTAKSFSYVPPLCQ